MQPDVQTHTCLQPTVQEDNHMSVNMSHTIVARLTQSDCSSGGKNKHQAIKNLITFNCLFIYSNYDHMQELYYHELKLVDSVLFTIRYPCHKNCYIYKAFLLHSMLSH